MTRHIYIAGPWVMKAEVIQIAKQFEAAGFSITSRWFEHQGDPNDPTGKTYPDWYIKKQAQADMQDILRADAVVVLNLQKSEGKAVETGIALSHDIPVISVGGRSNIFQTLCVEVPTVEDAIEYLS